MSDEKAPGIPLVVVTIKVKAPAREALLADAKAQGLSLSSFGRQLLAIGYREWKKGKR